MESELRDHVVGFAQALRQSEVYNLGKGTFRYRFSFVEEKSTAPNSTVWLFSIYEAIEIMALIVDSPREAEPSASC